jgi:DNA-directed RNA polymerase I subunit RPA49
MSEKKRKRREDGGERPKKKVAIASGSTVKVEQLDNKGTLGPLLGTRKAVQDIAQVKMLTRI